MTHKVLFAILFYFISFSCLIADTNEVQQLYNEANNLYTGGKYREALSLYHQIDSLGYESGELYYNLGNTYYKLGQIGNTILFYEKARLFIDGDEDLSSNLELAQSRAKDKIQQLPQFFLESLLQRVLDLFSLTALAFITLVFFYFLAMIVILQMRDLFSLNSLLGSVLKYTVLVLFLINASLFAVKSYRIATNQNAVVLKAVVNLKSEPKEQSTTISVIHEGLKVEVTRQETKWLEVKLPDGTKGWIVESDVGMI